MREEAVLGREWRAAPVVAPALGIAVLVAWLLREHADLLPSTNAIRRSLAATRGVGHHGSVTYLGPPAVAGEAMAHYVGLIAFAMNALMVAIALVGIGNRSWARRMVAPSRPGVGVRLASALAIAVLSALITAIMGVLLLRSAISPPALVTAAVAAFQYSFVVAVVVSAAVGVP